MSDNSLNRPEPTTPYVSQPNTESTSNVIIDSGVIIDSSKSNPVELMNIALNIINPNIVSDVNAEVSSAVSKLNLEKYLAFVSNSDMKQVIIILTNNSAAVQDIVHMIDLILVDGKVDMADAPLILGLIKKIIALRSKDLDVYKNLTLDHFLDIIKIVFTILAKEGILKIQNADEFIEDINKLISLLKLGGNVIETLSCYSSCFGCSPSKN